MSLRIVPWRALLLVTACLSLLLPPACVRAGGTEDAGSWFVFTRQSGAWLPAPDLPVDAQISCHVYGVGRLRVLFRQGEEERRYLVDLAAEDWFSFTRQLHAGPVEVKVEPLPDGREAHPQLRVMVATSNAEFQPSLDDFDHPLYARMTNLGDTPATIRLDLSCQHPQRYYSSPGYLTPTGFAPGGGLAAHEQSGLLNWSRLLYGRSVLHFQPAGGVLDAEMRLFADPAGKQEIKRLRFTGNPTPAQTVIAYPQPDNTVHLTTTEELFSARLADVKAALQGDNRPLPKRARIFASVSDAGESLDTYRQELALARLIGANSGPNLGRLEPERTALGFGSYWTMNFFPFPPDAQFDAVKAENYVAQQKSLLPRGQRSVIILSDEPIFRELEKNPAFDKRFIAWMQANNLTPADAGVAGWEAVHCIEPTLKFPRLSVLSRTFQQQEIARCWQGYGQAFRQADPDLDTAVNFGVDGYYSGEHLDLWELYRQPGLEIVWGEDWHGYMPLGMGAIAWYADLMRSQAKYRHLPTGVYPILGYGYSPAMDAMRYYERFMRGCWNFDMYPYSPRGNEVTWLDNPQVTINIARRHRDLAQVEDILVDGAVQPARVALLYPRSSELWDRSAFTDIFALYVALLHAGIPTDILSEQDLVDGLGKDYQLIYCVGANMRKDALHALDAFTQNGGTVACASPDFRDPNNEPIPGAAAIFGAQAVEPIVDLDAGRPAYELPNAKPLATARIGKDEIPIYCQQSRLTPSPGAEVLATFTDGQPALLKSRHGKGTVYLYACSPGLSYVKADYGDNSGFATAVGKNDAARRFCALPAAGIAQTVTCSAPLVSSRVVVAPAGMMVGLVDYGIGALGRETPKLNQYAVDIEKMPPYPITVRIACPKRPATVKAVRAGQVKWEWKDGMLTVEVPLRMVDMLRIE